IFHLSFAYAIYSIYQNWAVYFSPQVLMVTVLFTFFSFRAVYLARRIHQQAIKLQRSKLALEHFAEELKSSNKNIERISYLDPVTGLYNFRYFRQRLAEELDRAGRYQSYLSLLIIDVDNFKSYNELFGHQKGDKVLSEIGKIIKNNTREVDVLARYIGDEFALALVDADADLAVLIANRIKKAVEEHRFPGEEEIPESKLTVSIGIAVYPENAQTMEGLIKKAENALHKVKLSRRNRIRVYSNIFEEIRSELGDSEKLIDTLQTLLVVINARDRYTYGHSERVMRYALALGRRLGLDSETLKQLKYGAFLHDIGKIEIDREILNKKEPLTDEEWELIKEHPRFGVSILESIRGLEDILDIVKYHHERYDGRGYPDGLQGEEIPLCARILAVADSFDAMTSNRPYRDALPKEVALKELERGKGLQFDPQVVEAFFDVVDEVEKEIEGLAG
ncbi:MAG: diguanylate cyclase, partial [Firmicutes bacterium]|nr:diguanylate cyclase [Bacillota bacterium]